jgi:hypothetical protein
MKPISVWYHAVLSSQHRVIDPDYALNLVGNQMEAVRASGLLDRAAELHVGVNGPEADAAAIACFCDSPKTQLQSYGPNSTTEIHTLNRLRNWLRPDWYVLYHHTKGVSTPNQADNWRRRMERYCVWNWQNCVDVLEAGYDACGCHWLTPEKNPGAIASPFFGGTFWWATSNYLMTLPPLPEPKWENRYEAEAWIGKGPNRPNVYDMYPGWPTP